MKIEIKIKCNHIVGYEARNDGHYFIYAIDREDYIDYKFKFCPECGEKLL